MDNSRKTIEVNDCLLHEINDSCQFESDFNSTNFRIYWENLTVRASSESHGLLKKIVKKLTSSPELDLRNSVDILKSASGYAEAGQMIAIMGPSGAGKTTLLAALAKRIQTISGTINVDGIDYSNLEMSRISSYVPQFDPLPALLTVAEYIAFSCALRLDGSVTSQQREILVHDIIINLNLGDCKDSMIGTISGGEKKRLSLAAEIVTRPRILFIDEPTTGLDTSAALQIIESIKSISTRGIVMCSIHQPSMMIYNLFDRVIFLTNGRTAFSGSLKDARIFFQSEGFQCPSGFDEVEYYVKILSHRNFENISYSNDLIAIASEEQTTKICQAYSQSNFSQIPSFSRYSESLKIENLQNKPRWIVQLNWLLWRRYLENRRGVVDGLISFNYYAISLILLTIFFWGIDTRKQRGIQDVMGFLYMASSETIFSTAYTPLYEIESEIPTYLREVAMYCPSAYYLATLISWIPKSVLKSFLLAIMLVSILGTWDNFFSTFLQFIVCTIISGICGTAYGSMIAALIESNAIATSIMVPIDLIALLMSGVYYSLRTLKWYTAGFKYLSIFYYTNEALAIAHWSKISDIVWIFAWNVKLREWAELPKNLKGGFSRLKGNSQCESYNDFHCIATGSEVLLQYGYDESNFWLDILGMIVLTIVLNFVGYLGIRRRRSLQSKF